ncbi:unnamed protein product [Phytomonas sp. EM1]|nr:unnamed protein product [Phytomonas sp. EM1]|eukprot:CCW63654.1 unnamed protein product [Phytomonas sp. isolate EM1]
MLGGGDPQYNFSDSVNNPVKGGTLNASVNQPSQFISSPHLGSQNFPNTTPPSGQETHVATQETRMYKGVHPIAALFHILFKAAAFLCFIFGNFLTSSYVISSVMTIIFCASDFWITKNITGRLLVALRWWNEVREDGSTHWVFESAPNVAERVNSYDNWFFWITLVVNSGLWLVLCVLNLMSLSSLPVALMGFVLSGANLLGYLKCRRDAKGRVTDFIISQAVGR